MEQQLEGAVGRLTVQASMGLSADAWSAMTAPEGSGLLTCVVVSDDAKTDRSKQALAV